MARPAAYTIHVEIAPRYRRWVTAATLRAAARAALRHQHAPCPAALSVRVTGDADLRALNRRFRAEDHATDVLSFPSGPALPAAGAPYLGDIAVSYARAAAQARRGRHSVQAELQLLVVHGVLHLLGHDHATPAEQAAMWAAQAEVLRQLGAAITAPGPLD
ncbi:MAG: rRNA maturation RNase YbeY [Anaerolineales bacterium]|nr:rRNA maturation RNase YbeY [Anaerolineales bacterium]